MMSHEEVQAWPAQKWMKGQKVPPLHAWLDQNRCDDFKDRMASCGNIVVPPMAFLGLQTLAGLWR